MNSKNVLIIGASSGLGRAVALQYAKQGAQVIAASRSLLALEALQQQIVNESGKCHIQSCNICSEEEVRHLVTDTIERFGCIDLAVFSSAIQYIDTIDQLDIDEVDSMFQTNVVGIIRSTRHVLPHMIAKQSGQIVLISSIMGEVAFPHMVSYGATKAALTCFAQGLQREVTKYGINVTLVSPGHMNTNLSAHLQGRTPHWYGQSGSLSIDMVAKQLITAVEKKRAKVLIGQQSTMLSLLNRFMPPVANFIISKITS